MIKATAQIAAGAARHHAPTIRDAGRSNFAKPMPLKAAVVARRPTTASFIALPHPHPHLHPSHKTQRLQYPIRMQSSSVQGCWPWACGPCGA